MNCAATSRATGVCSQAQDSRYAIRFAQIEKEAEKRKERNTEVWNSTCSLERSVAVQVAHCSPLVVRERKAYDGAAEVFSFGISSLVLSFSLCNIARHIASRPPSFVTWFSHRKHFVDARARRGRHLYCAPSSQRDVKLTNFLCCCSFSDCTEPMLLSILFRCLVCGVRQTNATHNSEDFETHSTHWLTDSHSDTADEQRQSSKRERKNLLDQCLRRNLGYYNKTVAAYAPIALSA